MAISISIDNDRLTTGDQTLTLDESAGTQPLAGDDGNDINVTDTAGDIGGLLAPFNTFLNGAIMGAFTLSADQVAYAAGVDGASSATDFVKVTTTNNEAISNLYFSDANGNALQGALVADMTTLDGSPIYLWSDGDYCIATTSATAGGGRIVAAFYLADTASDHKTAQIQMVTFEPINHPDDDDPDDTLSFTDVLQVSATGSISFDFDNLESGNFLWAAVGSDSAGLLVTGRDLNVVDSGGKIGDIVKGGSDPSDSVNTSQGGINATIGVNSQHFVDVSGSGGTRQNGPVGVFTLVRGYDELTGVEQATGINVNEIDYDSYINTTSASIFISQTTGSGADGAHFVVSLWEAGGGDSTEHATGDLKPEEGLNDDSDSYGYIGNQNTDSHLNDDTAVDCASVSVKRGNTIYTWTSANSGQSQGGITVSIDGNDITFTGIDTADTISFTAKNDAQVANDGTFNRFTVQGLAGTDAFDIGRVDLSEGVSVSKGVGGSLFVDDDGPAIGPIADGDVQFVTGSSVTKPLGDIVGTDTDGTLQITNYATTLVVGDVTLTGIINSDKTEVKYFEDMNGNSTLDSGETHYYTLALTSPGGVNSYTFSVVNAPPAEPLRFDFDDLPSGQNLFGSVADSANGPGIFVFGKSPALKANGTYTNASNTINTSQGGIGATIGVNNQMFDAGEGAYFTFCVNIDDRYLSGITGGLDQGEADDADNMLYTGGLKDVDGAFLGISQTQGNAPASLKLTAIDLDANHQGRALINNRGGDAAGEAAADDIVNITRVIIYDANGNELEDTDGSSNSGSIGVDLTGNTAVITGLQAGYKVEWETGSNTHNQVLVEAVGGKFDIGFFGLSEERQVPDHVLEFTVTQTDEDLDAASDTFQVNVDAFPFI